MDPDRRFKAIDTFLPELPGKLRSYRDGHDLARMQALLSAGRATAEGNYYVHPGDLAWWLFYPYEDFAFDQCIFLWEDPARELLGWVLVSPAWSTVDVFIQPELRSSPPAQTLWRWAEQRAADLVIYRGAQAIETMWIGEGDAQLIALLHSHGFRPQEPHLLYLTCSLEREIELAPAPPEFEVRPVRGEAELERRAAASHAAFGSTRPFAAYCDRYLRFMRSPVYAGERDLVAAGPSGPFGAFCIYWLDSHTRTGLFEPVGTHPDFQRRGLARAVLTAGLQRMQAAGMTTACVCVEHDNPAAQKLYQSVGFKTTHRLLTFRKQLSYRDRHPLPPTRGLGPRPNPTGDDLSRCNQDYEEPHDR